MAIAPNVYLRQLDIISRDKFNTPISIIGAGATGSMLCFFLTKMGMNNIKLWDHDFVSEHNSSNQLFKISDINMNKAERVSQICEDFNGVKIKSVPHKFEKQPLSGMVVLAVDSMKCRKEIFDRCKKSEEVIYVIDPRSGPEYGRVYTIDMRVESNVKFWENNYYPDSRTEQLNCTANAIIYGVSFLSSIITSNIKRIIMGQPYYSEIIYDIANCQLLTK